MTQDFGNILKCHRYWNWTILKQAEEFNWWSIGPKCAMKYLPHIITPPPPVWNDDTRHCGSMDPCTIYDPVLNCSVLVSLCPLTDRSGKLVVRSKMHFCLSQLYREVIWVPVAFLPTWTSLVISTDLSHHVHLQNCCSLDAVYLLHNSKQPRERVVCKSQVNVIL